MIDLRQFIWKNHAGLFWPMDDRSTYDWLKREEDLVAWATSHVKEPRIVVQAGGNCGLYVAHYAKLFDRVHTFEPDALNFRCLVQNVPYDNVSFYRAALGDEARVVGLKIMERDRGMTRVDLDGRGVRMMKLDSLGLSRVDLIHLDIEGCEFLALAGAAMTIERCRPVVAVEINMRCQDFGHSRKDITSLLECMDYREAGRLHDEYLFLPV